MGKIPVSIDPEELRAFLKEEAARETPSTKPRSVYETVVALLPEIDLLLAQRRTRQEIVNLLKSKGVEIGLGTFSTYYAKAKRETSSTPSETKARTPRKRETGSQGNANETPARTTPSVAGTSSQPTTTGGKKPLGGFDNKFVD